LPFVQSKEILIFVSAWALSMSKEAAMGDDVLHILKTPPRPCV
jgi:hypothetical protein